MAENLNDMITESRPSANENTIAIYERNIKHIMNGLNTDDYDFLYDLSSIMEYLEGLHKSTKRNYLNALIVLMMALNSNGDYDELIAEYDVQRDILRTDDSITDKQINNMISVEELKTMITNIGNDLYGYSKRELNNSDHGLLNVYIVFEILFRFPLRNSTLINMKWTRKREYNKIKKHTDANYIVLEKNDMFFCINNNEVSIPKDLQKILRTFYLKSTNENVFNSSSGSKLTSNVLSQLMIKHSQKYIGKNISSQIIRKIIL